MIYKFRRIRFVYSKGERLMKMIMKHWPFWLLVCVAIVFGFSLTGNVLRFPLGLGLLRFAFLVTEQVWTKFRI